MADPPQIRRPALGPPPIPAIRAPANTDVFHRVAGEDVIPEDTRSLEAPDAGQLVEHMLALVATEAEALLAGDESKLADLNVRTALATWDALHETDEALRLLEIAEQHPLVPRLRFAAALAVGTPEALAAVEPAVRDVAALALELAEAWLWRHGRADRAAELADRVLRVEHAGAWHAHVVELAALAHAATGGWPRVIELRVSTLGADSDPEEVAATAALVLDRAGDADRALALCWTKLEVFPGVPDARALGWIRTFDVAIDAATILDDVRRFELLDKRAELIAALPGGALEALATRHAVASELDRDGQYPEAAALWSALGDDPVAQGPGAARRVALLRASWSAAAAGAEHRKRALAAHRKLADSECSEVAATHAWRALELAAAMGDPALDDLARAVVDAAGTAVAERWLDLLELATPGPAAMARFESRGGLALRWAAAIAERKGEPLRANPLWRRAAAEAALPPRGIT